MRSENLRDEKLKKSILKMLEENKLYSLDVIEVL